MSIHGDAPPALLSDPHGIQYATGKELGKGGFAICYRAEVVDQAKPSGKLVALKTVKSRMEPAKLAQKVLAS